MIFTSSEYLVFVIVVFSLYWLARKKELQNAILLVASYIFYGYVHPWFCGLIAFCTAVNYSAGLLMARSPHLKRRLLAAAVVLNLGLLAAFKYFDFFLENIQAIFGLLGIPVSDMTLGIFLPVGISFYTFQTLGYTIDVYRGHAAPKRNIVDFALFASLFPQLVAGPIERVSSLFPQIEKRRVFQKELFVSAFPLLVRGFLKKLVIADNVAVYVDKVFMLEAPALSLLIAGALAFAVQIYADFSAYTDIARGSARLLGFTLIENF
jgi:D-alanyl-lipoteichoic acid acyltransferase DltB (MBOAT superfamily)